jgi:membrane associated rhomboid family serine protease
MFSKNPVTISLIAINTLVFAFIAWQQQSFSLNTAADVVAILHAGANFNPLVMDGEYWRLVSNMFLHFGFIHLAVNMYGLWQLGELLEPGIGSGRYAILYFICGLSAGIASLFFNVLVISAGASGAIFGLYGFLLGAQIISFYKDKQRLKQVLMSFGIFVAINALIARGVSVDMAGHVGGAVAGFIIAFCHFKLRILKTHKELAIALVVVTLFVFAVPKIQLEYYNAFRRLVDLERRSEEVLNSNAENGLRRDSLVRIGAQWKGLQANLKNMNNVPSALESDVATLTQFSARRATKFSYHIHLIDKKEMYRDSLNALDAQFKKISLEHPIGFLFVESGAEQPSK